MSYSCNICNKTFTTNGGLKRHNVKKTPCVVITPINSKFICDTCNHSFTSNHNLRRHIANICPIIKNRENRKNTKEENTINNLQYQIDILNNTVNELKLMITNMAKKPEIVYIPKMIGDKDIITGIVYLIQPEELLQTNRYKIGCSLKNDLSRVCSYKKNSRYLYIAECINPHTLESNIKSSFNNKYTLIAGKEYFEGDEKNIVNDFVKIVNDYNNEVYNIA
jgi:hypothetical protein